MNNKEQREKLIPIIIELEVLREKNATSFLEREKNSLDSAIKELKQVMGDSLKGIYELRKKKELIENTLNELMPLLDILEESCAKAKLVEPESTRTKNRIKNRKKVLSVINQDFVNQCKDALSSLHNNLEKLSSISTNEGVIYREILKRNKITSTQLLNKLIDQFYPGCKIEQYKEIVQNILYGKVKNPDSVLWNNMLICLLELSNTDQKDPQQYFQSQFDLYIESITNSLEEIEIPNLECTIAEENQ